jgi:hypothetical protein
MSHTYVELHAIPNAVAPRGALLVDLVLSALRAAFTAAFTAAVKRPVSRAQEAAEVRALARQMMDTDPSFAADLMAAAARHEGLDDIYPRR